MSPQRYPDPDVMPCLTLRDAFKGVFIESVQCVPDGSTGAVGIQMDTCCQERFTGIPANHSTDHSFDIMRNNQLGCLWANPAGSSGKLVFKGFK